MRKRLLKIQEIRCWWENELWNFVCRIEVTRRRRSRRRMLLDDLKQRRGYSHLKEEALDRTIWRARFGRGFGPVVRQTAKWIRPLWWCILLGSVLKAVRIAYTLFVFWNIMRNFLCQFLSISANCYVHMNTKFTVYGCLSSVRHAFFLSLLFFKDPFRTAL
jgi:hypothetical protein